MGRDVDVSITYKLLPSLSDAGRVPGELDVDISIETVKNFYVGLSGYDTFDSRPPEANLSKHDYGVTFSLRWKFQSDSGLVLTFEPRAPSPEPRAPSPEPRAPSPEPRAPSPPSRLDLRA